MKINLHLALLIVLAVLLNACKKSGSSTDETPAKKLKYLAQIVAVNGTTTSFTNLTYDDKKRLSTVKKADRTSTYTYDGNNLFSIDEIFTSGRRTYVEYTYQDGKIKSFDLKAYNNTTQINENVYTYVYAGDRVSEIHYDLYVRLYTYDNSNNIIKVQDGSNVTTYSYDNKPNKFVNAASKLLFLDFDDRYSPNNVVQSANQSSTTTYTYNYDSDGYPTGAVTDNKTLPYTNTKYTYVYTEL